MREPASKKGWKVGTVSEFLDLTREEEEYIEMYGLVGPLCKTPRLPSLPVISRHDSVHEFIEHGNSERCISMMRTPDHAFCDQLVSCRTEGGNITPKLISYVT